MPDTDAVLLQRFIEDSDAEAFADIVRQHAGLVYSACKRILSDSELASDAAQDTFFQLLRHAGDVKGAVAGWLHMVATRKAIDIVRKDVSRKRCESEYTKGKLLEAENWDEISPYVDEALGEIDEELRDVLVLHFLEGLSMREAAGIIGVSQPTVSRRVESGITMLRSVLKKRGVIVAAVSLSTLMGQSAVEAAPAALISELGKMGIIGAGAAAASGATTAKAAGVTFLTAVKAKVVAAVAVAAIGTGAVVTYNNVTKEPEIEPEVNETAAAIEDDAIDDGDSVVPANDTAGQPWITFWTEVEAEEKAEADSLDVVESQEYIEDEAQPVVQAEAKPSTGKARSSRSGRAGGAVPMGGMVMGGGISSKRVEKTEEKEDDAEVGGLYQNYYGGSSNSSRAVPSESENSSGE